MSNKDNGIGLMALLFLVCLPLFVLYLVCRDIGKDGELELDKKLGIYKIKENKKNE